MDDDLYTNTIMNNTEKFSTDTFVNMVRGNGVFAEQAKALPLGAAYAKTIKIKGSLAVIFQCGTERMDNPGYKITGDADLLKRVIVDMEGDMLILAENANLQPAHRITVYLRLPCPQQIILEDQADCKITGITPQNNPINIQTKGTSCLFLQGETKSYYAKLAGAGELRAEELHVKDAELNILGVGCVWASVSDQVKIESDGPGDVVIYGNPKEKTLHATGSCSVIFMKPTMQMSAQK